jgi:hypothetical protein
MKAYKFFSQPNNIVTDGRTGLPLLKFDQNGEYVTLDPVLAKRMSVHFKSEEIELAEVKEEAKEELKEPKKEPETTVHKCKKCGFEANNKGELLAHYRSEHPKEG